ncbi:MAG TPA: hypothetical protein VLM39_03140 [Ignavibacteriaceae bacterium]|nr:hypothetical protein [Ignavibacteriaceae bacterium]
MYKVYFILIFLTAYIHPGFCQGNLSIGAYLGGGSISGTSLPQGSFTSSIFLETSSFFHETINLRFNFIYAEDFNILLPGSRNNYYPFLKSFSIRGVASQPYGKNYFAEETIGFIIIDDRTFAGVNELNYGTVFSLGTGIDFRSLELKGFKVGVGLEYAITFGNSFAKYFSLHLQSQYFF